ncbi:MAG: hypothetical protein Q9162_003286 [Coniocarpon cinnabarinum]
MDALLHANSIYNYLCSFTIARSSQKVPFEISESLFTALANLTLAEATLLTVLKDDGHAQLVTAQSNVNNTEWMIRTPSIPSVRAQLLSRLCMASSDHAARGTAAISASNRTLAIRSSDFTCEALERYLDLLKHVARARSCRFAAIDAEAKGALGTAIGWLRAAMLELDSRSMNLGISKGSRQISLSAKWKQNYAEKRENKLFDKHGDWGQDAGQAEEVGVIENLLQKWQRINDTVNFQAETEAQDLLGKLPTGREFHKIETWLPPTLNANILEELRTPGNSEAHEDLSALALEREFDDDVAEDEVSSTYF